jgi:hypothetical protein
MSILKSSRANIINAHDVRPLKPDSFLTEFFVCASTRGSALFCAITSE